MKRLILFCCAIVFAQTQTLVAQTMVDNTTNFSAPASLKGSLENILKDYPNAFRNIMGDEEIADPQYSAFPCKVPLAGALSTHFTRFNTPHGNVVTFEAVMYQSEEFKDAAGRYKSICHELKKGIIKMGSHRPYIMDGQFSPPSDEKKFNEVIYSLMPADKVVDKLKIVIGLDFVFPEWQVTIKLYDKGGDDTEEVHGDEDDDM